MGNGNNKLNIKKIKAEQIGNGEDELCPDKYLDEDTGLKAFIDDYIAWGEEKDAELAESKRREMYQQCPQHIDAIEKHLEEQEQKKEKNIKKHEKERKDKKKSMKVESGFQYIKQIEDIYKKKWLKGKDIGSIAGSIKRRIMKEQGWTPGEKPGKFFVWWNRQLTVIIMVVD